MKKFNVILILLIAALNLQAQTGRAVLFGESGDGKVVKMMWFLKAWETGLDGFDIRRKSGSSWEKLNSSTILPAIIRNKPLSNVESNITESNRVSAKMNQRISSKKIKEHSQVSIASNAAADADFITMLNMAIASDYDVALASGFALTDRAAINGENEYGLFFVKNGVAENEPAAVFKWQYGNTLPNVSYNIRINRFSKSFQLNWKTDTALLKNVVLSGYNVYRREGSIWKKLTPYPVSNKGAEADTYSFIDKNSNTNQRVQYAVSIQTIFGNEGKRSEAVFEPAKVPLKYTTPSLEDISSPVPNTSEKLDFAWSFSKEQEKYIEGFVIEKATPGSDYSPLSELLSANTRKFSHRAFDLPAGWIGFRITAKYIDDDGRPGNEKLVYYIPPVALKKPGNFRGTWKKENDQAFIELNWDAKTSVDSLIKEYHLYASSAYDDELLLQASLPTISGNTLRYELFNKKAVSYKFRIVPVSVYNTEGQSSDLLTVPAPATFLMVPRLTTYSIDDRNRITIQWTYDEPNIKGFRLYQNNDLIADENVVTGTTRTFTTGELKEDEKYVFELVAVGEGGNSEKSIGLGVPVYRKGKF